ncbi:hypothetical protein BJX96DRAFT_163329 [Aspergillus floccosus]
MAMSHPGVLHQYASKLVAYEYTSTPATPKPNSLLFVGGLTDGLGTVPYVTTLAKALETTDWSLFHLVLTSSYKGWGLGSLDQDIEEIGKCVDYVRRVKGGSTPQPKVVVMGHSTGSQDVLHYLIAPNPVPRDSAVGNADELMHQPRPPLDGAIMQAPVSDREAVLREVRNVPEVKATYDQLVDMARRQVPGEVLPLNFTTKLGFPSNNPINAYRFLSLASPDSPAHPADDDLFSTDLTDQRLAETFGVVAKHGMLRSRLMALYSGEDEYAVPGVDKNTVLARWKKATNAGGEGTWDDNSAVIPGASHNVQDPIHKRDGALGNLEAHGLGPDHHLHLETVSLALRAMDDLLEHALLVQPEASSQVTHAGHQHDIGDKVGRARGELPEQIPPVHTALDAIVAGVPRAADDVGVRLLLDANHLRDEFGVVAKVGVHDDDVVASGELESMDVGGAQAQLARARSQVDMLGSPELLELLRDFEGAIGRAVVDNHYLPIEVA